jgi:hypothetical protein
MYFLEFEIKVPKRLGKNARLDWRWYVISHIKRGGVFKVLGWSWCPKYKDIRHVLSRNSHWVGTPSTETQLSNKHNQGFQKIVGKKGKLNT